MVEERKVANQTEYQRPTNQTFQTQSGYFRISHSESWLNKSSTRLQVER